MRHRTLTEHSHWVISHPPLNHLGKKKSKVRKIGKKRSQKIGKLKKKKMKGWENSGCCWLSPKVRVQEPSLLSLGGHCPCPCPSGNPESPAEPWPSDELKEPQFQFICACGKWIQHYCCWYLSENRFWPLCNQILTFFFGKNSSFYFPFSHWANKLWALIVPKKTKFCTVGPEKENVLKWLYLTKLNSY